MPVDKPKPGETEQQYLAYCIAEEVKAGKEQEQASAICYSNYRNETKMSTQGKISSLLRQEAYKGINLMAEEGSLEDACWEGYEAIGTKILDGREVPNCVPITE
jgi:hypothetical protein